MTPIEARVVAELNVVPAVASCLPTHGPTMGFGRFSKMVFCPMDFLVYDDNFPVSHEKKSRMNVFGMP